MMLTAIQRPSTTSAVTGAFCSGTSRRLDPTGLHAAPSAEPPGSPRRFVFRPRSNSLSRNTSTVIAVIGFAWLLGTTQTAVAQSAAAQAWELLSQGRTLMDQGTFGEACARFEDSRKLVPGMAALINLAWCRLQNKQFATAWELYLEVEHVTRAKVDNDAKQQHENALKRMKEIEPKRSKLRINVSTKSQIDGLNIRRGAEVVDLTKWNREMPIDGGTYKITA